VPGQRTTAIDARNDSTSYGYDAAGRLTSITDAPGRQDQPALDAAGQTPQGAARLDKVTYSYDAAGNSTSQTGQRSHDQLQVRLRRPAGPGRRDDLPAIRASSERKASGAQNPWIRSDGLPRPILKSRIMAAAIRSR